MTNKEKLQEVLRKTFHKTTFILAYDELSQTEEIFYAEEWLKKPYEEESEDIPQNGEGT